jgi:formate dehydrogenase major subunit
MTNGWTDVANADVILVMGGNPAENHPVGFRFAMEAKRSRKAKLITIDPRFNRTAAVSDVYVPIRAGTDIAFLGGLLHYALTHDKYQRDYVKAHTNASFLIKEGYAFNEGLFSGWDEAKKTYDKTTWGYEIEGASGFVKVDESLEHPRSVFQLMKAHYARYTPEMVASICGCTAADFEKAAEVICSTGTADRQGTILYALGWTQHSHSVQLIHTAAMLQLMLGNIGMPGGGVNAQRGHSNIQGATDMGAWNMLPGYLRLPRANQTDLKTYLEQTTPKPLRPNSMNYSSNNPKFVTSLLKAYYGAKATKANNFGYDNLPKLGEADNFSWGYIFDRMYSGGFEGLMAFGMNPVANGPNTPKMLAALGKLKWLIVADCFETETASFWKARDLAGQYYASAPDAAAIDTEVFLLPAACFAEKDGAFVNSSRWVQWKYAAVEPPGQAWRTRTSLPACFSGFASCMKQKEEPRRKRC